MTATLEFRSLDLLSQLDPLNAGEGIRIQIIRGFLMAPDARGEDYVIASRQGRFGGSRVADTLSIGLAGYIIARTAATWRDLTDDLLAVLDESGQEPGSLVARPPYLGISAEHSISARVKNVIEGEVQAGLFQRWSIELESIDPYWATGS